MVPKLRRALYGPPVEAKQASNSLIASDLAPSPEVLGTRCNEPIPESLVVSFMVVVLGVFANERSKILLAERNDLA